jgi:hypothetical protein
MPRLSVSGPPGAAQAAKEAAQSLRAPASSGLGVRALSAGSAVGAHVRDEGVVCSSFGGRCGCPLPCGFDEPAVSDPVPNRSSHGVVGGNKNRNGYQQQHGQCEQRLPLGVGLHLRDESREVRVHSFPPQKSNLDASGMRLVRKGGVVRFRGGATARVAVVRLGQFATEVGHALTHVCRDVEVVA